MSHMVVFGAFANVYGKHTFGKVAILPTGACAVLPSQQGCFAGMLMNPDLQACLEGFAVAKRTHLEVPVYHLPVKVADYRFSAWMQILCDHKSLRKLKRSLDIFQSTLLARTKPIPKRPWQIFAEGIGSSVLQELSPAVACLLLDRADLLERASCWAKSLPQFCIEFFNSGFTSSQSFWNFRELPPGKRLGDSY